MFVGLFKVVYSSGLYDYLFMIVLSFSYKLCHILFLPFNMLQTSLPAKQTVTHFKRVLFVYRHKNLVTLAYDRVWRELSKVNKTIIKKVLQIIWPLSSYLNFPQWSNEVLMRSKFC